jgi:hypothetical protein
MISPRLSKVVSGTRLTTDLLNSMIKRTEYAADLLQQYKLIAGNEMYVEPHYDGTRVSYFSPVGGGINPVVPLPAYKYRMLFFTPLLFLISGGPSYTSFQIQLQRYTGTGTNEDPIIPRTWETPENYTLSLNTVNDILSDRVFSVAGEYVEIYSPSVLLASQNGNFVLQLTLRDAAGASIQSSSRTVSYPYQATINITNVSFPAGLTNARLIFDYYIGPVVDFSPVQVNLSMTRNDPTTGFPVTISEAFNISPSNFFASGTYTSNATFNTLESTSPLTLIVGTYFRNTGSIQVNPN